MYVHHDGVLIPHAYEGFRGSQEGPFRTPFRPHLDPLITCSHHGDDDDAL